MSFNINPGLLKYIDQKSVEFIEMFEEHPHNVSKPRRSLHSIENKISEDWSDKMDRTTPQMTSSLSYLGETTDKWVIFEGKRVGLSNSSYLQYKKFIKKLQNHKDLRDIVHFKFLENKIFDWLYKTYTDQRAERNMSIHVINEINEVLTIKTYCFPILNLEISAELHFGDVIIRCITKQDFDNLKNSPDTKVDYKEIRKMFQGMVIISCKQYGVEERAKEIAFEKCSMIVDVFKVCSDTLEMPNFPLSFDLEERSKIQSNCTSIIHKADSFEDLTISWKRLPQVHEFDKAYLDRINTRQVHTLALFTMTPNETELQLLTINAIKNFALALSETDLNKRVVEIFSIYESLLLPNESAPIIDSLVKYGTKMIFSKPDDRKHLKKLFQDFYKIRSSMVHHGKKLEIDLFRLKQLQLALLYLLINLITKYKEHPDKASIQTEIDEAINEAY